MRETAVESHPFRKVREKDGAPGSFPPSLGRLSASKSTRSFGADTVISSAELS